MSQVIFSSSQLIVSTHDNDAILPCHVEPLVEDHEWWRLDLPPDPEDPQSQHRHVPFKTETWEDGAVQGWPEKLQRIDQDQEGGALR